ncbi:MAG: ATP synthase F0 subunit B [Bacteriovoracaceae bacterium]|nr:ATP synthase F0 subunit B [Bacteriovoracaceae bacterium]
MLFWFVLSQFSQTVMAASDGAHHGSVYDLIAPAVNFLILFGFLSIKLKKPISNHFTQKATDIEASMKRASEKAKQAEKNLAEQKAKLSKVDAEVSKIMEEAKTEVTTFVKNYDDEIQARVKKMRVDGVTRVEAEKNSLIMEINGELIDKVVAKTKEKISKDSSLQTKVAANLLKELR